MNGPTTTFVPVEGEPLPEPVRAEIRSISAEFGGGAVLDIKPQRVSLHPQETWNLSVTIDSHPIPERIVVIP